MRLCGWFGAEFESTSATCLRDKASPSIARGPLLPPVEQSFGSPEPKSQHPYAAQQQATIWNLQATTAADRKLRGGL